MKASDFFSVINSEFFTGVPDSQLKGLCDYLMQTYGCDGKHHIIGANEGNCVALAAGYYMATKKIPTVYLQNSGLGNIINPVVSLSNERIYGIPVIFIIGWRGEPGMHDEPQHLFQGEITEKLLIDIGITYFIIDKNTSKELLVQTMNQFRVFLNQGKSVAFLIKKNVITNEKQIVYKNDYNIGREEAIKQIINNSEQDIIVSTTGKTSRELYEIRESRDEGHKFDFLTVGSMGHSSSIALSLALNNTNKRIWCIDGDGALLMHMGAIAIIGHYKPKNLVHVIINNRAHESVGGMPTVTDSLNIVKIGLSCGYDVAYSISTLEELEEVLQKTKNTIALTLLEIKCSILSRKNLGRPTTTPRENIESFMDYFAASN